MRVVKMPKVPVVKVKRPSYYRFESGVRVPVYAMVRR